LNERKLEHGPVPRGQRELSVSYAKVADVLQAQGNLAEALKSYRDSLATGDRLAKADPTNTDWQSYLSVSYQRVGEVLQAQGNLAEALKSYHDSLANCRPPGQGRPLQYRLAKTVVLYVALGDVLQA
jgi:tetratricopeptide (TPR) repeat protein